MGLQFLFEIRKNTRLFPAYIRPPFHMQKPCFLLCLLLLAIFSHCVKEQCQACLEPCDSPNMIKIHGDHFWCKECLLCYLKACENDLSLFPPVCCSPNHLIPTPVLETTDSALFHRLQKKKRESSGGLFSWHSLDLTLDNYQVFDIVLDLTTTLCPTCHTIFNRVAGCDVLFCPFCRLSFCFVCGSQTNRHVCNQGTSIYKFKDMIISTPTLFMDIMREPRHMEAVVRERLNLFFPNQNRAHVAAIIKALQKEPRFWQRKLAAVVEAFQEGHVSLSDVNMRFACSAIISTAMTAIVAKIYCDSKSDSHVGFLIFMPSLIVSIALFALALLTTVEFRSHYFARHGLVDPHHNAEEPLLNEILVLDLHHHLPPTIIPSSVETESISLSDELLNRISSREDVIEGENRRLLLQRVLREVTLVASILIPFHSIIILCLFFVLQG